MCSALSRGASADEWLSCPLYEQDDVPTSPTSAVTASVKAATPEEDETPYLEPLLRNFVLGAGAGVIAEMLHVLFTVSQGLALAMQSNFTSFPGIFAEASTLVHFSSGHAGLLCCLALFAGL